MKKTTYLLHWILTGVAFFLFFPSCSALGSGNGTDNNTGIPGVAFDTVSSLAARMLASSDDDRIKELVSAENSFAIALYKELTTGDENFFFSPHSIVSALGMAATGARGDTEFQMRSALQTDGKNKLNDNGLHAALNDINLGLDAHAEATAGLDLNIVNDAWGQQDWTFNDSYLESLAKYYGAGMKLLAFKTEPDKGRTIINTHISDITNAKIKNLLPEGSISNATRLVLTNAVYFLAGWLYTFDKNATAEESFHRLDKSEVSVPLMKLGEDGEFQDNLRYAWSDTYKTRALELPYEGERLAMIVFLPDSGQFTNFENAMTPEILNEIIGNLTQTSLPPVRLPKFTYESPPIYLVEPLQALGMTDAFDASKADFSGIDGTQDLYISNILHKSFIAVDEAGTEAAAATAIVVDTTSIPTHEPSFVADRPFIYIIRDNETGLIIFMGKVADPTT